MNLPATAPPVPRIVNFTDAQQVNAGTDFTLQWTPFSGASADDFISIYISDGEGHVVFQAPDFCIPRPLPVTATSILIPANTLRTNQTYHAEILFGQMFYFSTNTVSNMSGYGNTIRATQFPMATSGGAIPGPASLGGPRILPNGHPAFELTGAPLATYGIQRAEGLDDLTWSEIGTVTLNASGQGTFEDSGAGTAFPRFYRAVPK